MCYKLSFYKYKFSLVIILVAGLLSGIVGCKESEVASVQPRPISKFLLTNNYHSTLSFKRLAIERAFVYYPKDADWHYSHHPSIIYYKGKFIAVFSNGLKGEDEGYQRIMTSTSTDGKTWSECKVIAGTDAQHSLTSGGLYINDKDELIAYFTISDYGEILYRNAHLLASVSTDGVNWSERINLNIPLFMSHSPKQLENGRLIITAGTKRIYYSDNSSGLADWVLAENAPNVGVIQPGLVEGDFVTMQDSIYVLFRDTKGITKLWQQSSKNGETWTPLRKTNFTNGGNKFHFGKLPDGRYYYVGTPDTLRYRTRDPLVLALSKDGYVYDENYVIAEDNYSMRYTDGRWKDGQFGYPHTLIHENNMYVIVSRQKESIEVIKIDLTQLHN